VACNDWHESCLENQNAPVGRIETNRGSFARWVKINLSQALFFVAKWIGFEKPLWRNGDSN
jgi:hypothetical protein